MIANARMYSVTPAVGALWRQLLEYVADRAGQPVEVLDWPVPKPLAQLWAKPDKAAVFMCGLPFSLASPQPELVAAPVPTMPRCAGKPVYWSDLVVRADSSFHDLADTFGRRIALTIRESQSGFAAPLYELMQSSRDEPLYREIIAPCITPYNALLAVIEGSAEVASLDAWAFALIRRHAPELATQVRVISRTEPMPIPALIASHGLSPLVAPELLTAHEDPALRSIMDELLVERFVQPDAESYTVMKQRLESVLAFWREHPLAETIHPEFGLRADAG